MKAVFVGGKYDGLQCEVSEVWKFASGKTPNYSEVRAAGRCVPCAKLDEQPKVSGYCGPMLDGWMLRYETWEVYEMLSR